VILRCMVGGLARLPGSKRLGNECCFGVLSTEQCRLCLRARETGNCLVRRRES